MNGMSATTGLALGEIDHLRQSIKDILTTPIGSRVMRRDYGSNIYELIDAPMNRATLMNVYVATAEALEKWEPRIRLLKVTASAAAPGSILLDMECEYLPNGTVITLDGVQVQ